MPPRFRKIMIPGNQDGTGTNKKPDWRAVVPLSAPLLSTPIDDPEKNHAMTWQPYRSEQGNQKKSRPQGPGA
ncbi:hypothetical protein SXCC_02110 [Gluconacetobacter sp. SXCC-1]|nr:hypothetical protein SXCC_02110 [Gluconacetobacter sp. SXCC-1]